ncbi:MAG: PqqD family protein [candidate division WOR-3 bacterium]
MKSALMGAGSLLLYAALRKIPLPARWVPRLKNGTSGSWQGEEFVLRRGPLSVRLNSTGGEIAEMVMAGGHDVSWIAAMMSKRYGIHKEGALRDITSLLRELDRLGFLA